MATPLSAYVGDRRPRILIVDDEPVNLKVLAAHLVRWGCEVEQASSGPEALARIPAFAPDLILLDVMMPGQSGLDVCRHIQADPTLRRIPVIFLSAAAGEQAKELGLEVGARDYVTKPFMSADLAARVGAQLQQRYAEDSNG
jgi:CheY-like chemotaxis protein